MGAGYLRCGLRSSKGVSGWGRRYVVEAYYRDEPGVLAHCHVTFHPEKYTGIRTILLPDGKTALVAVREARRRERIIETTAYTTVFTAIARDGLIGDIDARGVESK